jgi:hypothetical protein
MPHQFRRPCKWLIKDYSQPDTMELMLHGRGRIAVTEQSVSHTLGLTDSGKEVKYELQAKAIKFIHDKYDIVFGTTPRIEAICERVRKNKEANEDFMRSFLMVAISTFLCPPTSLGISPRCYPELVDLSRVKHLNWSQFVVRQLKDAASKINKKASVRGCILVLVVSTSCFAVHFFSSANLHKNAIIFQYISHSYSHSLSKLKKQMFSFWLDNHLALFVIQLYSFLALIFTVLDIQLTTHTPPFL